MHILYKPGPDLYIADWLSRNHHVENKDWEIAGLNVSMLAINTSMGISICTSIENIQAASS